ncbi:hypothetical protein HUS96_30860 [Pseudomonas protegens]|nr:hypothetical protein [Pseudomonas protegens]MBP5126517.1 hypothetical protein [Pseudomonas protegens]
MLCNLTAKRYPYHDSKKTAAETNNSVSEKSERLTRRPVLDFNNYLRNAFQNGPCTCHRCRGGQENSYIKQHNFSFGGTQMSRRFASTTAGDVLNSLKKAWLSYNKLELDINLPLDLDAVMSFVDEDLQERLVPLFIESELVKLYEGELFFEKYALEY